MRPDEDKAQNAVLQQQGQQAVQAGIATRSQRQANINAATSVPELREQVALLNQLYDALVNALGLDDPDGNS